ncbi:MAG: hypothetical protein CfClM3_0497 [Methanobrevibacter sp. CfCl-M3]
MGSTNLNNSSQDISPITNVSFSGVGPITNNTFELDVVANKEEEIKGLVIEFYRNGSYIGNESVYCAEDVKPGKNILTGLQIKTSDPIIADEIVVIVNPGVRSSFRSDHIKVNVAIPKRVESSSSSSSSDTSTKSGSSSNSITFYAGSYCYDNLGGLYYITDLTNYVYMSKSKFNSYKSKMSKVPYLNDELSTPVYYELDETLTVGVTKRASQPLEGVTVYDAN